MADTSQHILDSLTTAVLLLDEALALRYINPAGEELLDVSAARVLGRTVERLLSAAPLDAGALHQALETGRPFTDRELRIVLTGGRDRHVHCTVTPVADPALPGRLLVEMQPVERHLRIAREESLLAQQQTSRVLVRGLAHEIKNPLGGLRGAAQLLELELPDAALKEYTQVIIREADRLQQLVDRLLGPNMLPRKRRLNVHEVLERVRALVEAEAGAHLTIRRDYDPSIPELSADPDQLVQALLNIARNAVQALAGHGELILRTRTVRRFTIGRRCHRSVVRIDVQDNGPGIPPEMLDRIFYPMVSGRAEGSGLGLSIAQMLVNQHGGLVECDSRPGQTVFSVYLPLENDDGGQ